MPHIYFGAYYFFYFLTNISMNKKMKCPKAECVSSALQLRIITPTNSVPKEVCMKHLIEKYFRLTGRIDYHADNTKHFGKEDEQCTTDDSFALNLMRKQSPGSLCWAAFLKMGARNTNSPNYKS